MKALMQKEWKLAMTPVPLVFLALSALVLVPSYPYYVTFFYTTLGIFLFFQSARENRDVSYMLLLPVGKRQMVYARVWTVAQLELLQLLCCVPFMCIRAGYGIQNAVGIEANCAFLGLGAVLLGVFNSVFLPMHYKNGYDLGNVHRVEHRDVFEHLRFGGAGAHRAVYENGLRALRHRRAGAAAPGALRRTARVCGADGSRRTALREAI